MDSSFDSSFDASTEEGIIQAIFYIVELHLREGMFSSNRYGFNIDSSADGRVKARPLPDSRYTVYERIHISWEGDIWLTRPGEEAEKFDIFDGKGKNAQNKQEELTKAILFLAELHRHKASFIGEAYGFNISTIGDSGYVKSRPLPSSGYTKWIYIDVDGQVWIKELEGEWGKVGKPFSLRWGDG